MDSNLQTHIQVELGCESPTPFQAKTGYVVDTDDDDMTRRYNVDINILLA